MSEVTVKEARGEKKKTEKTATHGLFLHPCHSEHFSKATQIRPKRLSYHHEAMLQKTEMQATVENK